MHHQLDHQRQEREREKIAQYEQFMKEKQMIDAIVERMYEEDRRASEIQMQKKVMWQLTTVILQCL